MANLYESGSGLNVNNHYGPREAGGTQGITKTEGGENEFTINLDDTLLGLEFQVPESVESVFFIGVQDAYADAAVTALTIGGVDVIAATEAAPVEIDVANTGEVVVTGPTGGTVVAKFLQYKG